MSSKITQQQQQIIDLMINEFQKINLSKPKSSGLVDWNSINSDLDEWNSFEKSIKIKNQQMLTLVESEIASTHGKLVDELSDIFSSIKTPSAERGIDYGWHWYLRQKEWGDDDIQIYFRVIHTKHRSKCNNFEIDEIKRFEYNGYVKRGIHSIEIPTCSTIEELFKFNPVIDRIKYVVSNK